MVNGDRLAIAVIGSGIAGITAAHLLGKAHDVTLFERNEQLGGHTNTRMVDDPVSGPIAVDTGFIVCNSKNYPNFYALLDEWQVERRASEMSFGFYCEATGLQYVGPALLDFCREPRNFYNPQFIAMIGEQRRFNKRVLADFHAKRLSEISLKDYLKALNTSSFFIDNYLAPLIASIWSSPHVGAHEFPAATFATFFNNHGMLEFRKRPQWQTLIGGSHSYLKAFSKRFSGKIRLATPIEGISRNGQGVALRLRNGSVEHFQKVVLASHADESLALLSDSDEVERRLLGAWQYSTNHAVLHRDHRIMPPRRRLWAAWNYTRLSGRDTEPVAITYYMNKLQGLKSSQDYFVTLNRTSDIDTAKIIYQTTYTHPIFTPASVATQDELRKNNGRRNTAFCGAYLRYGFHEDGVLSAIHATKSLLGEVP